MPVCVMHFDATDVGSLNPEVNDFISRSVTAVAKEVDEKTSVVVDLQPSNVGALFVGIVVSANVVATSRGGRVAVAGNNQPLRQVFRVCKLGHLVQGPAR